MNPKKTKTRIVTESKPVILENSYHELQKLLDGKLAENQELQKELEIQEAAYLGLKEDFEKYEKSHNNLINENNVLRTNIADRDAKIQQAQSQLKSLQETASKDLNHYKDALEFAKKQESAMYLLINSSNSRVAHLSHYNKQLKWLAFILGLGWYIQFLIQIKFL